MSDEQKKDEATPLFESVLGAMTLAERSGAPGPTKRQLVVTMMRTAGLNEEDEKHIAVIIDLIIWAARNAPDIKAFARKNGCLPSCCK